MIDYNRNYSTRKLDRRVINIKDMKTNNIMNVALVMLVIILAMFLTASYNPGENRFVEDGCGLVEYVKGDTFAVRFHQSHLILYRTTRPGLFKIGDTYCIQNEMDTLFQYYNKKH